MKLRLNLLLVLVFACRVFAADKVVGAETTVNRFLEENIDLSNYAGKIIKIELLNKANGLACESAYWDVIEINNY
ncbi:MAG: hypothetical protein LLF92_12130 [Planctomycetaceae bacterium]|nr:hypothetical protein [Planctomycetaceae bacterium]